MAKAQDELVDLRRQVAQLQDTLAQLVGVQSQLLNVLACMPSSPDTRAIQATLASIAEQVSARLDPIPEPQRSAEDARTDNRPCFAEINVERINVVEPDGTVRLVISNRGRSPDPIMDGKALGQRQGGRLAGLIFYNDEGDECGGLIYAGQRREGQTVASAGLMFDQFKQDQTISVEYAEEEGQRSAGLRIWDRPERGLHQWFEQVQSVLELPEGSQRDTALRHLRESGLLPAQRLFAGKRGGTAALILFDTASQPRIRLAVEAEGMAKIELLDEHGEVIDCMPRAAQVDP